MTAAATEYRMSWPGSASLVLYWPKKNDPSRIPPEPGSGRAEREGGCAHHGQVHAGAAGRFRVAADRIDITAELGAAEQQRPEADDAEDNRDHLGHPGWKVGSADGPRRRLRPPP